MTIQYDKIPEKYQSFVLPMVNISNIPIAKLVTTVPNDNDVTSTFWRKVCEHYYPVGYCNVRSCDGDYKVAFCTAYVRSLIENDLAALKNDVFDMKATLAAMAPFVSTLRLGSFKTTDESKLCDEEKTLTRYSMPQPDFIDRMQDANTDRQLIASKLKMIEAFNEATAQAHPNSHCDLHEILIKFKNLKIFDIQYATQELGFTFRWDSNGMSLTDVKTLGALISQSDQLITLVLKNSRISDDVCTELMKAIECRRDTLETLDLSHNKIIEIGVREISSYISGHSSAVALKSINLSHNDMTDVALTLLADALGSTNCQLTSVSLKMNTNLSDEGVARFIKSFEHNFSVKNLNLEGCNVGPLSVRAIADQILFYSRLSTLITQGETHVPENYRTLASQTTIISACEDEARYVKRGTSVKGTKPIRRIPSSTATKSVTSTTKSKTVTKKASATMSTSSSHEQSNSKSRKSQTLTFGSRSLARIASSNGSAYSLSNKGAASNTSLNSGVHSPPRASTPSEVHVAPVINSGRLRTAQDEHGIFTVSTEQLEAARKVMEMDEDGSLGWIYLFLACNNISQELIDTLKASVKRSSCIIDFGDSSKESQKRTTTDWC